MNKITKVGDKKLRKGEQGSHFTSCQAMSFGVTFVLLNRYLCLCICINIYVHIYHAYLIDFSKANNINVILKQCII